MIRGGILCKACTPGQCRDVSDQFRRIAIVCPTCEGSGCEECENGKVSIRECPKKYCQEIVPSLDLIDLYHKGLPPIAGGSLDQTQWFCEAARTLKRDEEFIKAEKLNG